MGPDGLKVVFRSSRPGICLDASRHPLEISKRSSLSMISGVLGQGRKDCVGIVAGLR